jgi:hypothetical protein
LLLCQETNAMSQASMSVMFWPVDLSTASAVTTGTQRAMSNTSPRGVIAMSKSGADAPMKPKFLIGWNPRGVTVCVADVVSAQHVSDAQDYVRALKKKHQSLVAGLRVIGRLHPAGAGAADSGDDDGSKACRAQAELWVELVDGPFLIDLFVCGYRYQTELFTVRYDASKQYQTTPYALSPVSNRSDDDVRMALAGGAASQLEAGARSVLEGPFLPSHCAQLYRRAPMAPPVVLINDTFVANNSATAHPLNSSGLTGALGIDGSFGGNDSMTPQGLSAAASPGLSPGLGAGGTGFPGDVNASLSSNGSGGAPDGDMVDNLSNVSEVDDTELNPEQPPRLSFPTAATMTELSTFLSCVNAGRTIRPKSSKPMWYDEDMTPAAPSALTTVVCSAATVIVAVLQPVLLLVSVMGRVSYAFSVLEFKIRELICALALVNGTASTCGLHPFMPHAFADDAAAARRERRICRKNYLLRLFADVALGLAATVVLRQYDAAIIAALHSAARYGLYEMHMLYFDWFLGWPAGFKMNDELNAAVGLFCRAAMVYWERLIVKLDVDFVAAAYTVLLAVGPFGLSFSITVVADCCNTATLHIRWCFHVLALVYRGMRGALASLTLQFRGRRWNPLHQRADECEFEADEMVIATLICSNVIFLLPTVAMYYFYLALTRAVIWVLQETLRALAQLACHIPLYHVWLWLRHRYEMPSGVTFSPLEMRRPCADARAFLAGDAPKSPRHGRTASLSLAAAAEASVKTVHVELLSQPMQLSEALGEVSMLARFLLAATLSPSRIAKFVLQAESRPFVDVRRTVIPHLHGDPSAPMLSQS